MGLTGDLSDFLDATEAALCYVGVALLLVGVQAHVLAKQVFGKAKDIPVLDLHAETAGNLNLEELERENVLAWFVNVKHVKAQNAKGLFCFYLVHMFFS